MATIDVPVRLVVTIDDLDILGIVDIITEEGSLKVDLCQFCFAMVPSSKISDHVGAMKHG
jgi:hypothetical protein